MFSVLLLLTTVINCGVSLVVDCTYEHEGVEYDFSPLLSRDYKDIFTFYGNSQTETENTLYWYNIICGNITSTPDVVSCYDNVVRSTITPELPLGYCPNEFISGNTCSTDFVAINPPVAAYQIDNDLCYRLHDGVTPPTITLVNETNPLSGVRFQYTNGDFCAVGSTNRDSSVIIFCNDSNSNASYIAYEYPVCTYILQISSVFGCPTACINYNTTQVCTNHGDCVYDNNGMHCSCDEGWDGDLCANQSELPPDATLAPNDSPSTKKDKEKKWPRWLGILLACLAGAFLCCCIAALLGWLMASKKNKGGNYSNNVRHAHPTPVTRTEYVPAHQEDI